MTAPVLYLFAAAAPPVHDIRSVIEQAHEREFRVCLGLTPTAARWLGEEQHNNGALVDLEQLTGHPVRSQYKMPGTKDAWPKADVIAFAPLTFNSLNAWALGLTREFVIGVVAEAPGKHIPVVAMPYLSTAFVAHPQLEPSVAILRQAGVNLLYGEGGFVPNRPGHGDPAAYPWELLLDAATQAVPARTT